MIFGSDLFFAGALETSLHIEGAGEMSVLAQALRVRKGSHLVRIPRALCSTGESMLGKCE
jgi:hypothetical protein